MRNTTMAFVLCLISTMVPAQDIIDLTKSMKCSDPQKVMNYFVETHKEMPVWVGKSVHNSHITLLMNRDTRSWTLIEYDNNLACVLSAGENKTGSSSEIQTVLSM